MKTAFRDQEGYRRTLLILGLIFFFIYSHALPHSDFVFNSPDERANAFFALMLSRTGTLGAFESRAAPLWFAAIPRSIISSGNGFLAPQSFWGLSVFFGAIGFVFGEWIIWYLTPLAAVLAVFALFGIVKKLFDSRVAFWSAVIAFLHPAVWLYASRGFYHNLLFTSLLTCGLFFFIVAPMRRLHHEQGEHQLPMARHLDAILAWLCIGFAVIVRGAEGLWIALLLLIASYAWRPVRRVPWAHLAWGIVVFLALGVLFVRVNTTLYGAPFVTGYATVNGESDVQAATLGASLLKNIFPFGLNIENILTNTFRYYDVIFWWLSLPLLGGLWIVFHGLLHGRISRGQKIYFCSWIGVTIWLFIYYGSWKVEDNPSGAITIADSHIRYWLPSFFFATPFIALFLERAIHWIPQVAWRPTFRLLLIIAFFIASAASVYAAPDGIAHVRAFLLQAGAVKSYVLAETTEDTVIVVDRWDKVFFPERRVIVQAHLGGGMVEVADVMRFYPVYAFVETLQEDDLRAFIAAGIEHVPIAEFGQHTLYKLKRVSEGWQGVYSEPRRPPQRAAALSLASRPAHPAPRIS